MKKIVVYSDRWQNGGVESYLMNQFRHWNLSEVEVTLLTAESTTDRYDNELANMGIPHTVLLNGEFESPIKRILTTVRPCWKWFQNNPCDVAYFNLSNSVSIVFALLAKWSGVKKRIVHSHCSQMQEDGTALLKRMAQRFAKIVFPRFATNLWACSDAAAEYLYDEKYLPGVEYIPNAIDVGNFTFNLNKRIDQRKALGISEASFVIGTVGRCEIIKNQKILIEMLSALRKQGKDATLLLVGDGSQRNALEEHAKSLEVYNNCIFYGFAQNVTPLLCAMDVFCLPSVAEGYGIAVVEAQANGLPCILSDAITRQVQIKDNLYFVPCNDTESWAGAFCKATEAKRLIDNSKLFDAGFDIHSNAIRVYGLLLE